MKAKVCGLKTADEVRAALELGFDYLGFVLEPNRPRTLSLEAARHLAQLAQDYAPGAKTVAVAVDIQPQWLPSEEEDPLAAFTLLQFYRYPRWPWPTERRLRVVACADECAHAALYLFDRSLGSGQWTPPPAWLTGRRVLFAGGVNLARLEQLRGHRLYGVDVSSGVEQQGRKNYQMMKAFKEALP